MATGIAGRFAGAVSISLLLGAVLAAPPALAAPGDPLGPAFLVGATSGTGRPVVARSASGGFVVVWHNPGPSNSGVTAQRLHADGSPDGGAIAVVPASSSAVLDLSVAMDGAGDFVVAWTAFDSVTTAWARRFPAAGPAAAAFQLDGASTAVRSSTSPSVAMNADGSFVIAWLRSVDSGLLQYNLPIPGCLDGGLGLELNDPAIAFRRYNAAAAAQGLGPAIAEAKPGIGLSAYVCLAQFEIYAASSALGPSGGSTLSAPVVAIGPGGGFSIAWAVTEYDGASVDILMPAVVAPTHVSIQPYSAGGLPLGVQQIVGLTPGLLAGFAADQAPRIAQGAAGSILVWDAYTYQSTTNSNRFAIKLRSFDNIGLPLQLTAGTVASGEQVFPSGDYLADVTASPAGSVVAWRSTSTSGATESQQINVQRLDSSGAAAGAPIVAASVVNSTPNATNALALTPPSVASDGSGNFAVFWNTLNYDDTQVLTYGRLYSGS